MNCHSRRRDIYLRIEAIDDYSPIAPLLCSRAYGRDCMRNPGHESGRVGREEILGASLDALVYREYLDAHHTIPVRAKLIDADVNEPPLERRVPGAVLYARPGERLYIHVTNADPGKQCHSFHLHGLRYGIDADGAWPLGVAALDGRRSDEIRPGETWTYVFEATEETIGTWAFHDHVRDISVNVNRGLFGGLIVRDPRATWVDHEAALFIHQMAGPGGGVAFQSPTLHKTDTFSFRFDQPGVVNYQCLIHGAAMSGTVEVEPGAATGPVAVGIEAGNKFNPQIVKVAPGGTVVWTNTDTVHHIVYTNGGGATSYCLNGRTFVGNTPTIEGEPGQRIRWYVFNLDLGADWHNFHPHSTRWSLALPPGGASDVRGLSPAESFLADSEIPPALRLPCAIERIQCDPPRDACLLPVRGDFLFHCHVEGHMMQGLAGLIRSRQRIWVTEAALTEGGIALPFDSGANDCSFVDVSRCGPASPGHSGGGGHDPNGHGAATTAGPAFDFAKARAEGWWELLPCDSRILPVHAAVLHTGKVLFLGGSANMPERLTDGSYSRRGAAVWNYRTGELRVLGTASDVFCCGHAFLPDGRLVVAGGTEKYDNFVGLDDTFLFDPITEIFTRVGDMKYGRWYPTLLTVADGSVIVFGGETGGTNVPEQYQPDTGWRQLRPQPYPLYPHIFKMADGFGFFTGGNQSDANRKPGTVDLTTGKLTEDTPPFATGDRREAFSVMLPPAQDQKLLVIGGGDPGIDTTFIINRSTAAATYTTAASMHFKRMHHNAVLLPDRTVFVSGGGAHNESVPDASLVGEIYNPAANTWTKAARASVPRLYHSIALLLPDGRVVAGGSNPARGDDELRMEVFHPPYLFRGPRPIIDAAPSAAAYGQSFAIHTPNAPEIAYVHIIHPMAVTHSCDVSQRLVDLQFVANGLCHIKATVPANPNLAPPGWYMLFMLNKQGVPSLAHWIHVSAEVESGGHHH